MSTPYTPFLQMPTSNLLWFDKQPLSLYFVIPFSRYSSSPLDISQAVEHLRLRCYMLCLGSGHCCHHDLPDLLAYNSTNLRQFVKRSIEQKVTQWDILGKDLDLVNVSDFTDPKQTDRDDS